MLVLNRRKGSETIIRHRSGDVLRIKVIAIGNGKVEIGFDGEREVFEIVRDNAKDIRSRFPEHSQGSVTEIVLTGFLPTPESCL